MILTNLINVTINSIEVLVKNNLSVFEVCKNAGFFLPRFCYHELLQIAGNCRMCLIEIANSPKPIAACVFPIVKNMQIFLNTPLVLKARENILEILLLNHPLDCPICDQGGECDLQDQTQTFGFDSSRFFFPKRNVEDKFLHPYIIAIMTRCIHCTRCIRFASYVLGSEFLGLLNRGYTTNIGNYTQKTLLNSNLITNIIDLCPVGALTAKSHSSAFRSWKSINIASIDLTDSFGSNVYIRIKNGNLDRTIAKINNDLNDNFISDRYRLFIESIKTNYFYNNYKNNIFLPNFLLSKKKNKINFNNSLFIINSNISLNNLQMLKTFKELPKIRTIKPQTNKKNFFISDFSNKFSNLNKKLNLIILVGCNLKLEATLINAKLRLKFNNFGTQIYNFLGVKLPFISNFINFNLLNFTKILEGKIKNLCFLISTHIKPFFILDETIKARGFKVDFILNFLKKLIPSLNFLNIYKNCNSLGVLNYGIKSINTQELINTSQIFFIDIEKTTQIYKICTKLKNANKKLFWLYSQDINNFLIKNINFIIPIKHYLYEKHLYVNLENKAQTTNILPLKPNTKYNLESALTFFFTKNFNTKAKKNNVYNNIANKTFIFNNFKQNFINKNYYSNKYTSTNAISIYPYKSNHKLN